MKSKSVTDPYLVIDQKGLRILVSGLVIAIVIGMTFKAIYSPGRIKYLIEKIIQDSNPQNASIKIDKAYLSLANGWWPRLAVVIENLEVQSDDPCLYFLNIRSDMMTLPVSLQSIFERSLVLKKIEMDHPVVKLKTKGVQCSTSLFSATAPEETKVVPPGVALSAGEVTGTSAQHSATQELAGKNPVQPIVENFKDGAAAQLVKTLSIELTNGELHFDNFPDFFIKEKKLQIDFVDPAKKRIVVDGEVELEPVTDDRLTGWKFRIQMESLNDVLTTHLKGHWREGSIKLDLKYLMDKNSIEAIGDFKQIALGQILIFTNELGWTKTSPSVRQSWISFHSEFRQKSKEDREASFENVRVEGEFGDVHIPTISAKGSPFVWQPLQVQLNALNISKLLKTFDRPHPSSSLSSLGVFRGSVDIEGTHLKAAEGTLQGLEFVFSNKGIRDFQTVSNLHLQITDADNQYKGKISDIELSEGSFAGYIEANYSKSDESSQVNFHIDELKLSPRVEKLMTSKGTLSSLQGKLNFLLRKNEKPEVQGMLKIDNGTIEKINFEKLKWELSTINKEEVWKFNIQDLKWDAETPTLATLQDILKTEKTDIEMKNLNFKAKKSSAPSFSWTDLQVQIIEPKSRLNSQGSWDDDGNLVGTIQIKSDKETRNLNLHGTRESPEWQ